MKVIFWIIIFGTRFKFSFCDKIILVCFGWGPDFDKVDFGNHTVISRQPISSKHCLEIKCRLRVQIFYYIKSKFPVSWLVLNRIFLEPDKETHQEQKVTTKVSSRLLKLVLTMKTMDPVSPELSNWTFKWFKDTESEDVDAAEWLNWMNNHVVCASDDEGIFHFVPFPLSN